MNSTNFQESDSLTLSSLIALRPEIMLLPGIWVLQMNLRSNWHEISSRANGQLWFCSQYPADTVSAATRWAEMTAVTLSHWDFLFPCRNNWCLGRYASHSQACLFLLLYFSNNASVPVKATWTHLRGSEGTTINRCALWW